MNSAEKIKPAEIRAAYAAGKLSLADVKRLIERLKTDDQETAADELVQRGQAALPVLLEALERRDVEMRRQAFVVLQRIVDGAAIFDPYAPELLRRQQIADLRERFERRAG